MIYPRQMGKYFLSQFYSSSNNRAISMHFYRKSYERECISWYMGTSDVFQVLRTARAAGKCNLRTWKTSRVTIYHEMYERSYDFLFIIFSAKFKKKSTKRDRHASMDTQLWNGFQTLPNCSHVLFQPINYNLVTGKPSLTLWSDQVFTLRAWKIS